jgi:hypothetical protein
LNYIILNHQDTAARVHAVLAIACGLKSSSRRSATLAKGADGFYYFVHLSGLPTLSPSTRSIATTPKI